MAANSKWPPNTVYTENFSFSQKIYVSLIWFAIYGAKHCIIESKRQNCINITIQDGCRQPYWIFRYFEKGYFSDIPYHAAHQIWVICTKQIHFWCQLLDNTNLK